MYNQPQPLSLTNDSDKNKMQDTFKGETQKGKDSVYKIILATLALAIVILSIANLSIALTQRPADAPISESEMPETENVFDHNFYDLTKEQTIAAFKAMQEPGYMPKGYADTALAFRDRETYIVLDYSYQSIEDIDEIDYHVSDSGKNKIDITPIDDYYVIITTDDYKEKHSPAYWPKAVSFNKEYVNYYEEEIENSTNDRVIFTNLSPEAVRTTLPVFAATTATTQINSIFSYEFEENDDDFVLTLNCIGISLDMKAYMNMFNTINQSTASISDLPYVITRYVASVSLDKETGKPSWSKKNDGSISNLIESFRLDEQEINELSTYISGQPL